MKLMTICVIILGYRVDIRRAVVETDDRLIVVAMKRGEKLVGIWQ
jgi:hypothetical protein